MQQVHYHTRRPSESLDPHLIQGSWYGDQFAQNHGLPFHHQNQHHPFPPPHDLPYADPFFDQSNFAVDPSLYPHNTFDSFPAHDGAPSMNPEQSFYQTTGHTHQNEISQNHLFFPSSRNGESTHPNVFQVSHNELSGLAPPSFHHHTLPSGDYTFDQFGIPQNFSSNPIPPPTMDSHFLPHSSFGPTPSSRPPHHLPVHSTATSFPYRPTQVSSNGPQSLSTAEDKAMAYRLARQHDEMKGRLTGSHQPRDTGEVEDSALINRGKNHSCKEDQQAEYDFKWGRNDGFVHENPGRDYKRVQSRE